MIERDTVKVGTLQSSGCAPLTRLDVLRKRGGVLYTWQRNGSGWVLAVYHLDTGKRDDVARVQYALLDRISVDLGAAGAPHIIQYIATVPPAKLCVMA